MSPVMEGTVLMKSSSSTILALTKAIWVFVLIVALSARVQALCTFEDFPTSSDMKLYSILNDAVHNNRPMMVKGFTAEVPVDQIIAHYHRVWKDRYADSEFGPWYQVSTLEKECLLTVQVASNAEHSQGRLVISNVPQVDVSTEVGAGVMKPSDAVVVSDLTTRDGVKLGRVTMLATADTPSEVARYYRSNLLGSGWKLLQNYRRDDAHMLAFRHGLDLMNVLIIPAETVTQVLVTSEVTD